MIRFYLTLMVVLSVQFGTCAVYEYRMQEYRNELTQINNKLDNINGAFDMAVNMVEVR